MKLLLDTQILIWCLGEYQRLPPQAKQLIKDSTNEILVSAASLWEISIKASVGKIKAPLDDMEAAILASGFIPLSITMRHAARCAHLPLHHRDPFDRMLVAQSIVEPAYLITTDAQLSKYGQSVMLL